MPTIMLRQLSEALVARLKGRAQAYGMGLKDTIIYLLGVGLERDPREAGKAGGAARAISLDAKTRTDQARHAARARWGPHDGQDTNGTADLPDP